MRLKDLFLEIFGPVEHEAEAFVTDVEHAATTVIHQAEKELTMSLPQNILDAFSRIQLLLSGASSQSAADAKTIGDLQAASAAKDTQIADLTQKLSDATSQLNDIETQLLAISPAPAV